MTDESVAPEGEGYRCPRCTGGFPELDDGCCPWCGQEAGEYDPTADRLTTHVVKKDGEERDKGLLEMFRK